MGRRSSGMCTVLLIAAFASTVAGEEIKWNENVSEAWQAARQESRPLLMFITSNGCKYCQKMKRETLVDADVAAEVNAAFEAVQVDAASSRKIIQHYNVQALPTILIIAPPTAEVSDEIKGYLAAGKFRQRLVATRTRIAAGTTTDTVRK